jgi:hypothetical protein
VLFIAPYKQNHNEILDTERISRSAENVRENGDALSYPHIPFETARMKSTRIILPLMIEKAKSWRR